MLVGAEECHLGVVLAQIDILEAGGHQSPEVYGLLACLDIEQHLCRQDAAVVSRQAEATQELLGCGVRRHPHIGRAYLLEYPLDETEGVEVSPENGVVFLLLDFNFALILFFNTKYLRISKKTTNFAHK